MSESPTAFEPVSIEGRIRITRLHMEAERFNDIEALMPTISRNCRWTVYPFGYWEGWDTIRELYLRSFPFNEQSPMELYRGITDRRVALWGESHCLLDMGRCAADYPLHANSTINITYDGNLFAGETVWLTLPSVIAAAAAISSERGLFELPGFVSLAEVGRA